MRRAVSSQNLANYFGGPNTQAMDAMFGWSAAGSSADHAQAVPVGRHRLRRLVFGEFFAGCCRKSRAMRAKGCDVFSIEINRAAVEGDYWCVATPCCFVPSLPHTRARSVQLAE